MGRELLAGVGRVDITPPLGVDLVGTSRRSGPANGIYQRLYATCLVLSDGEQRIALLDTDLLAIQNPTAHRFRELVARSIQAPVQHVLLNSTHTHGGPTCSPEMPKIGGEQERVRDEELAYIEFLGHQLAGAAQLAVNGLVPSRLAAGRGTSYIAVNRRLTLPDGRTVLGRNSTGPYDPEVGVLRIDTSNGRPLAAVVNFACHPGLLTAHSRLVNPDFPGVTRQVVEHLTGATCLFLQGAGGNVMTIQSSDDDPSVLESVGKQFGCEASRVFLELKSQPTAERQVEVTSMATYYSYEQVPIDRPSIEAFGVRTREVELPLMPLPTLAQAEAILAEREGVVELMRREGVSRDDLNPQINRVLWARRLVNVVRSGVREPTVTAEVQAIRINDVALVAVPGEAFVEMALAVKAQSPIRDTFFVGYSNGAIGYIPTRDAYPLGGYEVDVSYINYGLPSKLQPGAAERLVEVGLELLRDLAGEPAPLARARGSVRAG